ncbi:MAG: hypothetical protein IJ493_12795 [Clostridia bacterium]|nr:hypothetical protein [Clostridia bacterium]
MFNKIKRAAAILCAALLTAATALTVTAADMGEGKVSTTLPEGFDKTAAVIEGESYTEGNGDNVQTVKAADGSEIKYVYLKASSNDQPAVAKYTFSVDKHGKYSFAFALRTKSGSSYRDGKVVVDGSSSFYVARTDSTANNTIEYVVGYNAVELKPGEHTIELYLGDDFDDSTVKSIHLDKILVKLDAEIKAEAAAAPATADGTALAALACAAAAAVIVAAKKRA